MRPAPAMLPIAAALVAALGACSAADELEGTYDQRTPIADSEDVAYRFSLFRFGNQVGGVVRFYEIDGHGPAISNRHDNPFLYESFCTHFGESQLSGDAVAFQVTGPGGEPYNFVLSSLDAEQLDAIVTVGQAPDVTRSEIVLDLTDLPVDAQCSSAVEVVVELPDVTVAEAPDLALAAVFAGYVRTPGTEERIVTRSTVPAYAVAERGDGLYDRVQRVPLPRVPDEDGLSDAADGVQFGVGYIVLFDDGNHDGLFSHRISGDVPLALSATRVVLYTSGDPAGLHADVRARFEDPGEIHDGPGYALYRTDTEIRGETAYIELLTELPADARILLERIDEDNPEAFPVLLPDAGASTP